MLSLSLFILMFSIPSFAQEALNEPEQENVWTVNVEKNGETVDKWVIVASVNGKVTYGDRFTVRIPIRDLDECTVGDFVTTFMTIKIDSEEKKRFIEGRTLTAKLNQAKILAKAMFAIPIFRSHLVYLSIGWEDLEEIKEYFHGLDEITLTLTGIEDAEGSTIIASNYFDIPTNIYSTKGLNSALDRAKAECERLVNNE